MGAAIGSKGGVRVYLMNHRAALVRRGLRPMPMVQSIIDHMNEYSMSTTSSKKNLKKTTEDFMEEVFNYDETLGTDNLDPNEDFYRGEDVGEKILPQLKETLVPMSYDVRTVVATPRSSPV